jgi:predicted AAA+ superfamily ATPase
MTTPRYLEPPITDDLAEKMVFVAGPRQVGKTTMAKRLLERTDHGQYLNWDNRDHRRIIRRSVWPAGEAMVVLDELHKWKNWKGWIKGEFDTHRDQLHFLVTGSARLDIYRRGGDSLQGRYHHYRLHPFSFAEIERPDRNPTPVDVEHELSFTSDLRRTTVDALMQFGGLPTQPDWH